MNSYGVQQQNLFEETRRNSAVVCPQPRRVDVLDHHHLAQSLRWQVSHEMEICESDSRRKEMLDFILAKGGGGCEQDPFFTGSPPSRVSNPLTKDSLFRDELFVVAPPPPPPSTTRATKPPPPSSPRSGGGGGCVRAVTNYGNKPVVRVVGFSCLDRDRRSSVPTLA